MPHTTQPPPTLPNPGATPAADDTGLLPLEHNMFYPDRAELERGRQPLGTVFHDVLLVPPGHPAPDADRNLERGKFFRFPVRKTGERRGMYVDPPELWDKRDDGQRKVTEIADPNREDDELGDRGPLFSILPVRAEPGSSSCAVCYVINARHGNSPNAWSAEEWNTTGVENLPAAETADDTSARILIALPRGLVVDFQVDGLDKLAASESSPSATKVDGASGESYTIRPINLRSETEIWSQLRNGCVVGTTMLRSEGCIVPIVNVTSLTPRSIGAAGGESQ